MKCRLCHSQIAHSFAKARLLGREVSYFDCESCGYVQTEEPTWLSEAYASAINPSDTGIMVRNMSNVSLVLATLTLMRARSGLVVDYAGGHGFLVRLLRDAGINAWWADPYCTNLVARGFEYSGGKQAALVTAFEAYEHFVNPVDEMEKLLAISPNILLTTELISRPAPQPSAWWYYGLEHGQHIGFYRPETLAYLAQKFNLKVISDGASNHLFTRDEHSQRAWRLLIKLSQRMPALFSAGLTPKTWSDHLALSQSKDLF